MDSSFDVASATKMASKYMSDIAEYLQLIPGSSIVVRYIRSSHQNDPVRSAVELFLFLFAVYYLLSPAYSTKKKTNVPLSEEVSTLVQHLRLCLINESGS